MSAWVYLVSQFSHEALLFEALIIFGLLFIYAFFWLLSKRRYGSVKTVVPSGVVKAHLNELIQDAEKLRAQLFGILYQGGGETPLHLGEPSLNVTATAAATAPTGATADPQLGLRISELEAKIQEQLSVISKVETEKSTLATEIEKLKTSKNTGASGASGGDVDNLKAKLKELEDRLEEYSIIEDDLANLKRLQQENAALKKQISAGGAGPAAASAPAPTPDPTPTESPAPAEADLKALANDVEKSLTEATLADAATGASSPKTEAAKEAPAETPAPAAAATSAPTPASSPSPAPATSVTAAPTPAPTPAATTTAAPAEPAPSTPAPSASAPSAAPNTAPVAANPASTPAPATPASTPAAADDSNELLKEFEKMLNS